MPLRRFQLLLGLTLVWLTAAAEEPAATSVPPLDDDDVAHEAGKDIQYAPIPGFTDSAPLSVQATPIVEPTPAAQPVVLSPYIVRELPHRTYRDLNEAIAQHRRLEDHALYTKGNFEMLLPPSYEIYDPPGDVNMGPIPRLKLVLLKYSW
jgi:hypothetical protein